MAQTTIPWNDGSGDNIYLTYPSASGDQTVQVTSDANTGSARTKVVTFSTGNISRQLTVEQEAGAERHTFTAQLSSVDSDHQYYSIGSTSQAYKGLDNTSACGVTLTRGAGAETWIYFKYDTSSIPANARIITVACQAKVQISSANTNYVASKGCVMCSGTTVKTASVSVTANANIRTFETVTWTRNEVNDIRIKMYATRASSNVNTNYYLRIYGSELTIVYEV